jgi:hypothetical protein
MKTRKLILVLIPLVIAILMNSCNKDKTDYNGRKYINDISGTYSGEFTMNANQNSVPGTAVVTKTNKDNIQIHCYGEVIDTTIIMDVYENGDSIMLCNTGNEFYNAYGHMGNGYHMMDMGMGESEWMHHLQDDHQAGDEHYGSFDMNHHTFNYSFRMMDGDTGYVINFHGTKN